MSVPGRFLASSEVYGVPQERHVLMAISGFLNAKVIQVHRFGPKMAGVLWYQQQLHTEGGGWGVQTPPPQNSEDLINSNPIANSAENV